VEADHEHAGNDSSRQEFQEELARHDISMDSVDRFAGLTPLCREFVKAHELNTLRERTKPTTEA
jgi:hypothetical protein